MEPNTSTTTSICFTYLKSGKIRVELLPFSSAYRNAITIRQNYVIGQYSVNVSHIYKITLVGRCETTQRQILLHL